MSKLNQPQLPFEFVVMGRPISHQTKNKQVLRDWRQTVHNTARSCWLMAPIGDWLRVVITHYYDAGMDENGVPDSDNIVKPVRDALNGVIYVDDYQITDFLSRRRNLNASFRVRGISPALAEGFCYGKEFLHVLIEVAPNPADLN